MATYRILYNGHAANRAVYREQEIRLDTPHDWSNSREAEHVMLLIHKKLHEHFARYEILLVEKIS